MPLYLRQLVQDIWDGRFDFVPGSERKLPQGLTAYYDRIVEEMGDDLRATVPAVTSLLALAKEPLPVDTLAVLLADHELVGQADGRELLEDALGYSSIMLRQAPTATGKLGYTVYHSSFKQHLLQSEGIRRSRNTARDRLCKLVIHWRNYEADSPLHEYALRFGPAHLIEARKWNEAKLLLTNFDFMEAKCRSISEQELETDYRTALAQWEGDKQGKEMLQTFEERLRLEAHHIHGAPELLFPQLYNHLTWLDAPDGPLHTLCGQAQARRTGWLRAVQNPRLALSPSSSPEGHTDSVNAVAVSPDGAYVVSGSSDRTVKIWELESGRLVRSLGGHTDSVNAVAVSPDSAYVISGASDKMLKVWELESGRLVRSLGGHTDGVNVVAVSPDGVYVVSGSKDRTVKVWELDSGRLMCSLETARSDKVAPVAVTPDGAHLVVGIGYIDGVGMYELRTGRFVFQQECLYKRSCAVAVSPDGAYVVLGSKDRAVKVWELESGRLVHSLEGSTDGAESVTEKTRTISSGQLVYSLEGHTDSVSSVAVTPDGTHVASGSSDGMVKVWELGSGRLVHSLEGHTAKVTVVAVTPDGAHVVTMSSDGMVKVWELESGQLVRSFGLENYHLINSIYKNAVTVTPDGAHVVAVSEIERSKVWGLDSGRLLCSLELVKKRGNPEKMTAVAMSPDGAYVVSGVVVINDLRWENLWKNRTRRVKEEEGCRMLKVKGYGMVNSCGVLNVWELESGRLVRWLGFTNDEWRDPENGKKMRLLEGHTDNVEVVVVSPDGAYVVSGSRDGTVKVWDLEGERLVRSLEGHTGWVTSVTVTSDGTHVMSGSRDGTVKVWDLTTGNGCELFGNDAPILSVAISPDGRWVTCGDEVGRVWIFEWMDARLGPPIVTPWKRVPHKGRFWNRGQDVAFVCPMCRVWSRVPPAALGTELPCPQCGKPIKLNRFTINSGAGLHCNSSQGYVPFLSPEYGRM